MKVIFKYELKTKFEPQTLELPVDARVLSVGIQNHTICIWIMFNPEFPGTEHRQFSVVGTGDKDAISNYDIYLGTAQDNQYVWHIFENVL